MARSHNSLISRRTETISYCRHDFNEMRALDNAATIRSSRVTTKCEPFSVLFMHFASAALQTFVYFGSYCWRLLPIDRPKTGCSSPSTNEITVLSAKSNSIYLKYAVNPHDNLWTCVNLYGGGFVAKNWTKHNSDRARQSAAHA